MPLGAKVRAIRRGKAISQAELAQRLEISPSYLNLIEHDRRPLTAPLLIKLAQVFDLDLKALSGDHDARLVTELLEVFGDPIFEAHGLTAPEVRELASHSPAVARAILALYHAYGNARESAETLAMKLYDRDDLISVDRSRLPSEEVSDFLQRRMNHVPELEVAAEALRREAGLAGGEELYSALVRYLHEAHAVSVRVEPMAAMRGATRRFDAERRLLTLSEVLRRGSRNFNVAYQVGLLAQTELIDRLVTADAHLTSAESRALCRVALAGYFAGALLMPYEPFRDAAQAERYDVEVLANRFRTSFEQTCHRLTTLRRPGAEGVPFHFVRVDIAGNISKRFSASGLRFARFSGACARWCVFEAFLTPRIIRVQLSQMPDGTTYFWIARTLRKDTGGYHAPQTVLAIGLGCDVKYAKQLVYSDGVDLDNREAIVPIGTTCRLCERMDCEQRAFPALQHPLRVDENVRGISFFAPVEPR